MKLLNILTVMLLLTRTFAAAAGAVSSDPMEADRKWLKQQEDFSEQFAALCKGWEIGVEGEFAVKQ